MKTTSFSFKFSERGYIIAKRALCKYMYYGVHIHLFCSGLFSFRLRLVKCRKTMLQTLEGVYVVLSVHLIREAEYV